MELYQEIGRRLVLLSEDAVERLLTAQRPDDYVLVATADQGCEVTLVTFRPSSEGEAVETTRLIAPTPFVKDVTAWLIQRATARIFTRV